MRSLLFASLLMLPAFVSAESHLRLAPAASHLLVVSGISGETEYGDRFYHWSVTLIDAARERLGLPDERITYLAEEPERDPALIDAVSTKAGIASALAAIATRAKSGDRVFIVLIGHGNRLGAGAGESAVFNVPGPDMSAADLAALLEPFAEQTLAVINTASSSGPFVAALSAANRVVITATASGAEENATEFGGHFVAAFSEEGADTDKNGKVSLLEGFDFARRQVARSYGEGKRLQSEHALLDDNGDREGSLEPEPKYNDGALAQRLFIGGDEAAAKMAAGDPARAAQLEAKLDIERRIDELRDRKSELDPDVYEAQLEELLVELTLKNREIRQQGNTQ